MRFLLLLTLLAGTSAWAECKDLPMATGRYCIFETAGSTNPDVIYYLHGRDGKAESWGDINFYPEQLRAEWTANKKQAPRVVSISFGPQWLVAEKNQSPVSGYLELLRDQVIPAMEKMIGGTKGRRIILGESMGGFNSLQMAFKSEWFQRAAILCAPVAQGVDPFSSPEEVEAWIKASTVYSVYGEKDRQEIDANVAFMRTSSQGVFLTRANWLAADPLALAKLVDKTKAPGKFYLAAGFKDTFVLYEGNIELAARLKAQGVNVEWRPQWGGHCAIDIPTLARFLVP